MITTVIIVCSTVVFVVGLVLGFFAWKTFLDNEAYGNARLILRVTVCEKEIRELRKQLDKQSSDRWSWVSINPRQGTNEVRLTPGGDE